MNIRLTLDINVGDDPVADGITYFIAEDGEAVPDDWYSPEEWAEQVINDILSNKLADQREAGVLRWSIDMTSVELLS